MTQPTPAEVTEELSWWIRLRETDLLDGMSQILLFLIVELKNNERKGFRKDSKMPKFAKSYNE